MWESLRTVVPVVVLVAAFVFFYVMHQRNSKVIEEYANARGWRYISIVRGLHKAYPKSYPFSVGVARTSTNVIRFSRPDASWNSFEYGFTTRRGRHTRRHTFHVVSIRLPQDLPMVAVRPEQASDVIDKFFGAQDVQFESDAFNRAWLVKAASMAAA